MKNHYKVFLVLFILIIFFTSLVMYIIKANDIQKHKVKRLTIGRASDSLSLDPANTTDMDSIKVTVNIFETLVKYEKDGKEIIPSLAANWKSSEDGLSWIFNLRQGIKFHDNTKFDAAAVVFNFQRWMNTSNPYHDGEFSYWNYVFGGFPGFIKSVKAVSEYSVEIKLSKPFAPFLSTLAMPVFAIESPEAIKTYGVEVYKHPIGTGPFTFKSWTPNDNIILSRNNNYWNTPAKVDEVEFVVIPSSSDRLEKLKEGKILIADNLGPDDTSVIENDPNLSLYYRPCFNVGYLAINNEKAPFDNRLIRSAMSYAINKDELIKTAFNNIAKPAKTLIPPVLWGFNESIAPSEYNIEKSKELLKEAGFPNGFKTTLWVMNTSRNYFPKPLEVADFLKASFHKVNIEVTIKTFNWDEYLNKIKNGEHELALIGWTGDNIDPDNFLYTLLSSDNAKPGMASNYSFYKNKDIDMLLNQARETTDLAFREYLYRKLLEAVNIDMPSIPLAHTMPLLAANRSVVGYSPYITGVESLEKVDIKP
ncbi:ABC transporter substrate-binding protein [Candidatus Clostridium radicumherbarum]|uniref:ABC transporter substrate-binding protein n=1 Tax=Candidatus Clostridium radicumherbarum TaxID=3381662 RepID=A0ABW8TNU6_9CLOT